jgi:hypothetical protein
MRSSTLGEASSLVREAEGADSAEEERGERVAMISETVDGGTQERTAPQHSSDAPRPTPIRPAMLPLIPDIRTNG